MTSVRPCRDDERAAILTIVNAAAEAYRGVIPGDRRREPHIPSHEVDSEIAAGVAFWGYEADGALIGIMGIPTSALAGPPLVGNCRKVAIRHGPGLDSRVGAHRGDNVGVWRRRVAVSWSTFAQTRC